MGTCTSYFTVSEYLKGKVRMDVPENAIRSICADAGVTPESSFSETSQRERDLATAWLYVWIAGGPVQTGTVSDEDADWRHSEGGERMSANALKQYLAMANEIFDKYDLPTVGDGSWGFVGHGFRNPRTRR